MLARFMYTIFMLMFGAAVADGAMARSSQTVMRALRASSRATMTLASPEGDSITDGKAFRCAFNLNFNYVE